MKLEIKLDDILKQENGEWLLTVDLDKLAKLSEDFRNAYKMAAAISDLKLQAHLKFFNELNAEQMFADVCALVSVVVMLERPEIADEACDLNATHSMKFGLLNLLMKEPAPSVNRLFFFMTTMEFGQWCRDIHKAAEKTTDHDCATLLFAHIKPVLDAYNKATVSADFPMEIDV